MGYPDKIVIHCRDEKDRELVEFALRRYRHEIDQWLQRKPRPELEEEARRCGHMILEAKNAGT